VSTIYFSGPAEATDRPHAFESFLARENEDEEDEEEEDRDEEEDDENEDDGYSE